MSNQGVAEPPPRARPLPFSLGVGSATPKGGLALRGGRTSHKFEGVLEGGESN